jgi:hypothetical protein
MKLACLSFAVLCLTLPPQDAPATAPALAIRDSAWSPALGRIEVALIGPRSVSLSVEGPAGSSHRDLHLSGLPDGARLQAVRCSAFMDSGVMLALVTAEGESYSYRYAGTRRLASDATTERTERSPTQITSWGLSDPIFTEGGAPYRIVDVHNPGSDSLEITFRRGAPGLSDRGTPELDELIFVDTCPGFPVGLQAGRSGLLRASAARR